MVYHVSMSIERRRLWQALESLSLLVLFLVSCGKGEGEKVQATPTATPTRTGEQHWAFDYGVIHSLTPTATPKPLDAAGVLIGAEGTVDPEAMAELMENEHILVEEGDWPLKMIRKQLGIEERGMFESLAAYFQQGNNGLVIIYHDSGSLKGVCSVSELRKVVDGKVANQDEFNQVRPKDMVIVIGMKEDELRNMSFEEQGRLANSWCELAKWYLNGKQH